MLLGAGLAMDAFSVSIANGLREPKMAAGRRLKIAGTYALFQIAMPLIGWVCVSTVRGLFLGVQRFIPWIALVLLVAIGAKMIYDGARGGDEESDSGVPVGDKELVLQGIATSIDALSVGFAIASYDVWHALGGSLIIGVVTLAICLVGLAIGRAVGMRFTRYSSILGGIILIAVGLEIFVRG